MLAHIVIHNWNAGHTLATNSYPQKLSGMLDLLPVCYFKKGVILTSLSFLIKSF